MHTAMKQNKTNKKDLRAIYIASRVCDLALTIRKVYGCSWRKAEKVAVDVVNRNYC